MTKLESSLLYKLGLHLTVRATTKGEEKYCDEGDLLERQLVCSVRPRAQSPQIFLQEIV